MGNAESSNGSPVTGKTGTKKKTKATSGKTGGKSVAHAPPQRLIVEKMIDGVNMNELKGIISELKELKAVMEERKKEEAKGDEDEDDDRKLTIKQKLVRAITNSVEEETPVGEKTKKKLPFQILAFYWLLMKIITVFLIIYFTYTSYQSDQSTKNLSLDSAAADTGDSSSPFRTCLSVPNSLTQGYLLDSNGKWQSNSNFIAGYSVYHFTFQEFSHSYAEYQAFMTGVRSRIQSLANASAYNTIWMNLGLASSWYDLVNDGTSTHQVQLEGDPSYIFNRYYKTAVIGNKDYNCYAIPDIEFTRESGNFVIKYTYGALTTFSIVTSSPQDTTGVCTLVTAGSGYLGGATSYTKNGATCSNAVDSNGITLSAYSSIGCCPIGDSGSSDTTKCAIIPGDAGYDDEYDAKYFSIKYNIRSLITAWAVNQGILKLSALTTVKADIEQSYRGCYALYGESDCNTAITSKNKTCGASVVGLSYNETSKKCSIAVSGVRYNIRSYMDPNFQGMDPIFCLVKKTDEDSGADLTAKVCVIRMGSAFVYPFINHMGASSAAGDFYNWGYGCHCAQPKFPSSMSGTGQLYDSTVYAGYSTASKKYPGQYGHDYYSYCNNFDLMHGFIIFKGKHYDTHLFINALMAAKYTAEEINNMAYFGGFYILRTGGNAATATSQATIKTAVDLKAKWMDTSQSSIGNAYTFCTFDMGVSDGTTSTTSCSFFAMQTVDSIDQRVSSLGVNNNLMSCTDFVSIPDAAWDDGNGGGPINVPPTKLVQDYYEVSFTFLPCLFFLAPCAHGVATTRLPPLTPSTLFLPSTPPPPQVLQYPDDLHHCSLRCRCRSGRSHCPHRPHSVCNCDVQRLYQKAQRSASHGGARERQQGQRGSAAIPRGQGRAGTGAGTGGRAHARCARAQASRLYEPSVPAQRQGHCRRRRRSRRVSPRSFH